MSREELLVTTDQHIRVITLNRPERRNALSLSLVEQLLHCLLRTARDPDVYAVILAAAGEVFCSGHDLTEMTGRSVRDYREIFDRCTAVMEAMQAMPQPVIGQVQGTATAAGCQLAATCDLVLASERARFACPGVRIGLFCTTPMVALTRAIGRKRAMQMLLTGEWIGAHMAADWGLVNHVVPHEQLQEETLRLARQIAQASPWTVSTGKQAFYAQIDLAQPQAYAYAKEVMTVNALAEDAQEGISAFLQKRKPCWKNQ